MKRDWRSWLILVSVQVALAWLASLMLATFVRACSQYEGIGLIAPFAWLVGPLLLILFPWFLVLIVAWAALTIVIRRNLRAPFALVSGTACFICYASMTQLIFCLSMSA